MWEVGVLKNRNDASASIDGIIYQFYLALKYAFELPVNRILYIEKFGDITINDSFQIEVKKYNDKLTDTHKNLWNTLYNWIESDINLSNYETLILLTTQCIGVRSKFKGWNLKSICDKLDILEGIYNKYSSKKVKDKNIEKILKNVLSSENRSRLKVILNKFIIINSSLSDTEVYDQLCYKYARGIPHANQKKYINSLLGFIISPKNNNDKWEITFEEFNNECIELTRQYCKTDSIFPRDYSRNDCSIDLYSDYLFVKKVKDIDLTEEVQEAIFEYAEVHSLLIYEFLSREVTKEKYDIYEKDVKKDYQRLYRSSDLNVKTGSGIKESKLFYYDIMTKEAQQFMSYSDTPKTFRNGILHILANDNKENIVWKLGDNHE